MTNEGSGGGSSVGIVAIVAIVLLVGIGAWFVWGRSAGSRAAAPKQTTSSSATPAPSDNDVHVKVDLPDTVTIGK